MYDIVALALTTTIDIRTNSLLGLDGTVCRHSAMYPAASIGGAFPLPAKILTTLEKCFISIGLNA